MKKLSLQQSVLFLLFIALSGGLLYVAQSFLIPLAFGLVLALLFMPLSEKMERHGFNRGLAAVICIFSFLAAAALLLGLLGWQVSDLADNIPKLEKQLTRIGTELRQYIGKSLGISEAKQQAMLEQQTKKSQDAAGNLVIGIVSSLSSILVSFIIVMVYTFLYMYYRSHFRKFILKMVSADGQSEAKKIISEAKKTVSSYLSGLGLMIVMLWVLYGIGFSLVGIKAALFFAVLCGVLEIIPFVGNLTGTTLTVLMAVAQGGDGKMIALVILVYGFVQFTQTYILEPLVVGSQININPFFTIAVIVLGEFIWGVAGMILALPLLGIVKCVCDHVPPLKPYGYLIGGEPSNKKGASWLPWKKSAG